MVSRGRVMEMVGGIYAGLEMCWRVGGAGRRRDGLAGGSAVVQWGAGQRGSGSSRCNGWGAPGERSSGSFAGVEVGGGMSRMRT